MKIQFFPYKKSDELKAFINTITQEDSFGDLKEATIKAGLHGILEHVIVAYSKESPGGTMIEGFRVEGTAEYEVYLLADTYNEERTPSMNTLDARLIMCLVVAKVPFVTVSWSHRASEPETAESCEIDEDWESADEMDEYLENRDQSPREGMGEFPLGMFYPENN